MLTIEEVREEVYRLGKLIGLDRDSDLYPLFTVSTKVWSEGYSFYVDDGMYHYVAMERGSEVKHYEEEKLEEVLYYVFEVATSYLAGRYELENRNDEEDFRRIRWKRQLELLGKIDREYVLKRMQKNEEILKISPYRDNR